MAATRGVDNFDNDGARDYLKMLTTQLVATITAIAADDERLELDEDGETMFMPSVEILALLCERYGAAPPKPAKVRAWHEKYLQVYDRDIDKQKPTAAYKTGRRKAIEQTFRWLEGLAETHWEE
jgi:hypothetical protein